MNELKLMLEEKGLTERSHPDSPRKRLFQKGKGKTAVQVVFDVNGSYLRPSWRADVYAGMNVVGTALSRLTLATLVDEALDAVDAV